MVPRYLPTPPMQSQTLAYTRPTGPEVTSIPSDVPDGCRVDLAAFFSRHGSRYPDTGAYRQWTDLHDRVQAGMPFNVTDPKLAFLKTWKPVLSDPAAQIAQVSPTGYKELTNMGAAWRMRYADLYEYNTPFTMWANWYSSSPRVRDSARMFAHGFLGPNATELGTIYALNGSDPRSWMNSLAPSDICPAYKDDGGSPYTDEWASVYLPPIGSRLNAAIEGGNFNFTQTDVSIIPYLCGFETQITGQRSPFCDIFTEDEILQYEYAQDLRYWYGTGLGTDVEKNQMLPILDMLVRRFIDGPDVLYRTGTNSTFNAPNIMASFSNDGQINQLVAATGVFDNEPQLPGNMMLPNRKFRASRLTPMRGTVAFERLVCDDDDVLPSSSPSSTVASASSSPSTSPSGHGNATASGYGYGHASLSASEYGYGYEHTSSSPSTSLPPSTHPSPAVDCTTTSKPYKPYKRANTTATSTIYMRVLFNDVVYPVAGCTSGPGSSCPLEQYRALVQSKLAVAGSFTKMCNTTNEDFASEPKATFFMDNTVPWGNIIKP